VGVSSAPAAAASSGTTSPGWTLSTCMRLARLPAHRPRRAMSAELRMFHGGGDRAGRTLNHAQGKSELPCRSSSETGSQRRWTPTEGPSSSAIWSSWRCPEGTTWPRVTVRAPVRWREMDRVTDPHGSGPAKLPPSPRRWAKMNQLWAASVLTGSNRRPCRTAGVCVPMLSADPVTDRCPQRRSGRMGGEFKIGATSTPSRSARRGLNPSTS
jgi:hypothetical protein